MAGWNLLWTPRFLLAERKIFYHLFSLRVTFSQNWSRISIRISLALNRQDSIRDSPNSWECIVINWAKFSIILAIKEQEKKICGSVRRQMMPSAQFEITKGNFEWKSESLPTHEYTWLCFSFHLCRCFMIAFIKSLQFFNKVNCCSAIESNQIECLFKWSN